MIYFHETRIVKATKFPNETLIVFTSRYLIAHKVALDKGFNFH